MKEEAKRQVRTATLLLRAAVASCEALEHAHPRDALDFVLRIEADMESAALILDQVASEAVRNG